MGEVVDLYAEDFPHGTLDGYRKGCKSTASCNGVFAHGISCKRAFERYQGDYNFRAAVDSGKTPAEIVAAEEADTSTALPVRQSAKFRKSEPNDGRVHAEPTVTVADSVAPFVDEEPDVAPEVAEGADLSEQPADVDEVKAAAIAYAEQLGIDYEKHGTTKGYYAGCREKEKCPGLERVGKSCTQAVSEYQKEMKQRRAAEGDLIAPKGPKPAPPVPVAVEAETERRVDDVLGELHEANRELAEVRQTLAVKTEACNDLYLQVTRLEGELAEAHNHFAIQESRLVVQEGRLASANSELEQLRGSLEAEERDRTTTTLAYAGVPLASVTVDTPPVTPLGLTISPTAEGGVSVHLQGGPEPVYLDLSFDHGQLVRAGVNTGK